MQIIKHLSKAGRYDINIISWKKTDWKQGLGVLIPDIPVVDIRIFEDGQPRSGICLTDDMVVAILLHAVKKEAHTEKPILSGRFGKKDFFIYEEIGTICWNARKKLLLTRSSFKVSDQIQYDLPSLHMAYHLLTKNMRKYVFSYVRMWIVRIYSFRK